MITLNNRGELPESTEREFENLNARMKALWRVQHNDDGTHNFGVMKIDASDVVSGIFDIARIPDLDASKITTGIFNVARIPNLDASKITTGVFDVARIPDLDASKITTGTFNTARIPNLDASKITTGTFTTSLIPSLDTSKITTGIFDKARIPGLLDWINVKDPAYGAVGDGTTDDTTAINAALAAVNATLGGVVYFPVGSYAVSNTLTPKANTLLLGAGKTSSGIKSISTTDSLVILYANAVDRVHLRDLGIYTNGHNQIAALYYTCNESTIISCKFGALVTGSGTGLMIRCHVNGYNNAFYGCDFESNQYGLIIGSTADYTGDSSGIVSNQNFFGCKWTGNTIGTYLVWANQILFSGCRWENQTAYGMQDDSADAITIDGIHLQNCYFENNTTKHVSWSSKVQQSMLMGCIFAPGSSDIDNGGGTNIIYGTNDVGGATPGFPFVMPGVSFLSGAGELFISKLQISGNSGTGTGTANFGSASPIGVPNLSPYAWVDTRAPDGTQCTMPMWKK